MSLIALGSCSPIGDSSGNSSGDPSSSSVSSSSDGSSSFSSSSSPSGDRGEIERVAIKSVYAAQWDALSSDYIPYDYGDLAYGISSVYGENKPMVSLSSFLENIYFPFFSLSSITLDVQGSENGLVYFLDNSEKGSIELDFSDCTITFTNYERVATGFDECFLDVAAIGLNDYSYIDYASDSVGFIEKGEMTVFDLGKYGIPLYERNGEAFLPLEIANYIFQPHWLNSVVYNGTNFYLLSGSATLLKGEGRSSFGEAYYGGALSEMSTKSEAVSRLDGNEMLFYLDHFYGYSDEEDFSNGWGSYLWNNYGLVYDGLFSKDAETYDDAIDTLMSTVIGDGHTSVNNENGITGSFYNGGRHQNEAENSERLISLLSEGSANRALRNSAFNGESLANHMVESSGETGIIRFDSFSSSASESGQSLDYYYQRRTYDTYALFVYAFKTFKENGIKRVVIDLTCNGGGASSACMAALGFLMDEVPYAVYNPLTGDMAKYKVNVDADADGTITGHDSYAADFSFYVLTSNYSFSCGNAFPMIAKDNGITTLGDRSGGGGCSLQYGVAPSGQPFNISGLYRFSKTFDGGITHADEGIEVDHEISKEYWYDIASLDDYLSTLN